MGAHGTNKQQAMCSTHRDIWWPAWAHQQDHDNIYRQCGEVGDLCSCSKIWFTSQSSLCFLFGWISSGILVPFLKLNLFQRSSVCFLTGWMTTFVVFLSTEQESKWRQLFSSHFSSDFISLIVSQHNLTALNFYYYYYYYDYLSFYGMRVSGISVSERPGGLLHKRLRLVVLFFPIKN